VAGHRSQIKRDFLWQTMACQTLALLLAQTLAPETAESLAETEHRLAEVRSRPGAVEFLVAVVHSDMPIEIRQAGVTQLRLFLKENPVFVLSGGVFELLLALNRTTDPAIQKMLEFVFQEVSENGGISEPFIAFLREQIPDHGLDPIWLKTCLGLLDGFSGGSALPLFLQIFSGIGELLSDVGNPHIIFMLFYFARCFGAVFTNENCQEPSLAFLQIVTALIPVLDPLPPFDVAAELLCQVSFQITTLEIHADAWFALFASVFRAKQTGRLSPTAEFHFLSILRKVGGEFEPLPDDFLCAVARDFVIPALTVRAIPEFVRPVDFVNEVYPVFGFSSVRAAANRICREVIGARIIDSVAPLLAGDELSVFSAVNVLASAMATCQKEGTQFPIADILTTAVYPLLRGSSWLFVIAALNCLAAIPEYSVDSAIEWPVEFVRGYMLDPLPYGDVVNLIVRYVAVLAFANLFKLGVFPAVISARDAIAVLLTAAHECPTLEISTAFPVVLKAYTESWGEFCEALAPELIQFFYGYALTEDGNDGFFLTSANEFWSLLADMVEQEDCKPWMCCFCFDVLVILSEDNIDNRTLAVRFSEEFCQMGGILTKNWDLTDERLFTIPDVLLKIIELSFDPENSVIIVPGEAISSMMIYLMLKFPHETYVPKFISQAVRFLEIFIANEADEGYTFFEAILVKFQGMSLARPLFEYLSDACGNGAVFAEVVPTLAAALYIHSPFPEFDFVRILDADPIPFYTAITIARQNGQITDDVIRDLISQRATDRLDIEEILVDLGIYTTDLPTLISTLSV
jgi:hypothetical protein